MKINCIGSGSSGNCYHITDGETELLLECGFNFKKIQQALNYQLKNISACLISHRHNDHIKGLKELLNYGINCYIGEIEKDELMAIDKRYDNFRLKGIQPLEHFKIGTLTILPFDVQHDTGQPLGYLIQSDSGDKLLFATDTYYIKYTFTGLTHMLIECNNSIEILNRNVENGVLNSSLKKRIRKSHFSLENVIDFLNDCDLSRLKETYLIHLSDSNSDEVLFKKSIQKVTGRPVYVL